MQIHILSDIHLETGPYKLPNGLQFDVLVAAGDISSDPLQTVEFLKSVGKPVILVLGNHDFWSGINTIFGASVGAGSVDMLERISELRKLTQGTNIQLLEANELILDSVRFLGCTYWTAIDGGATGARLWNGLMNDVLMIGASGWYKKRGNKTRLRHHLEAQGLTKPEINLTIERKKIQSLIVQDIHRNSLGWLEGKLSEPFNGKTIVVTHHPPSFRSVVLAGKATIEDTKIEAWTNVSGLWPHIRHQEALVAKGHLVGYGSMHMPANADKIDLWIHGHLHEAMDYVEYGVRCVANPRGYVQKFDGKGDVRGFNPELVINTDAMKPGDAFRGQIAAAIARSRELLDEAMPFKASLRRASGDAIKRALREAVDHRTDEIAKILQQLREYIVESLPFPKDVRFEPNLWGLDLPKLVFDDTEPDDVELRYVMAADAIARLQRSMDPEAALKKSKSTVEPMHILVDRETFLLLGTVVKRVLRSGRIEIPVRQLWRPAKGRYSGEFVQERDIVERVQQGQIQSLWHLLEHAQRPFLQAIFPETVEQWLHQLGESMKDYRKADHD